MLWRVDNKLKDDAKVDGEERTLRAFTIFNLADCLEELSEQGYFYLKEEVYLSKEGVIWDDIKSICMEFAHILTGDKKYLYVRKEELLYGEGTVMWLSDRWGELGKPEKTDKWVVDKSPVLESVLQEAGMILEPGVFQKISVEALQEQTKESLFSMLYRLGFRQLREGREKVKADCFEEDSFAWAGEFVEKCTLNWNYNYLYIVLVKRDFEEWDFNYDGKKTCVWRDTVLDIYITRSKEPMDYVCPGDEKSIRLNPIAGMEVIGAYLNAFAKLDYMLAKYINENEDR